MSLFYELFNVLISECCKTKSLSVLFRQMVEENDLRVLWLKKKIILVENNPSENLSEGCLIHFSECLQSDFFHKISAHLRHCFVSDAWYDCECPEMLLPEILWGKRHTLHLASSPWGSRAVYGCIWPPAKTILRICNTEFLGSFIDNINIYIVDSHLGKDFTLILCLNCQAYQ